MRNAEFSVGIGFDGSRTRMRVRIRPSALRSELSELRVMASALHRGFNLLKGSPQ